MDHESGRCESHPQGRKGKNLETYASALTETLFGEAWLLIKCSCIWSAARRIVTSYFSSDENLSFTTSLQHCKQQTKILNNIFLSARGSKLVTLYRLRITHTRLEKRHYDKLSFEIRKKLILPIQPVENYNRAHYQSK